MAVVHRNGLAIDLLDQGPGEFEGIPLLLLHSAGMGGGQWRNLIAQLSDRRRLVAPSLHGYGRSQKWPEGRMTDFAAERGLLSAALDHAGGRAHLVGHSMGAFLALELARREPDRFPTLTLVEPVALGVLRSTGATDALAEVGGMIEGFCAACEAGNIDRAMEIFTDYWYGAGAWQKIPKAQRLPIFARAGKMHQDVRAIWADETPAAVYGDLGIPALVLTGERTTPAARRMADILVSQLPDARAAVLPTAGHMAPVTHADLIARAIENHIAAADDRTARGRTTGTKEGAS